MNIKYATSEMGFEGIFPQDYPHMRVLETQLLFLDVLPPSYFKNSPRR